jgi:hypothetical protein
VLPLLLVKNILHTIFSLWVLLLLPFVGKANRPIEPVKKDTVIAQVIYGDSYLFDGKDSLSIEEINQYRDSLSNLPNPPTEFISQLDVYIQI